ncbi:tRNA-dihydrouridine(47) synthase [NAD(P)(+)] [Mollisia scopiformis]|uniref:tRNA-dihydrouridine(47) synthase [NAD(P)(+)] n=1 Tax=Mollisia scopiformis TaxID=149040 RepID=A0A194XW57_MOLSC|nr:tRNA-dihydrouridine(47) synthase [NAD(P)(+)] [Mollisia scopiformis]KUJ24249.1 tRNA-dihydrouridine(47) synthase [NAD(P)(+)] [Mollisia scopiformis]
MTEKITNPLDPDNPLKRPSNGEQTEVAHPPQPILPEDSAITKAEKIERNGIGAEDNATSLRETTSKRAKAEDSDSEMTDVPAAKRVKLQPQQNGQGAKVDTEIGAEDNFPSLRETTFKRSKAEDSDSEMMDVPAAKRVKLQPQQNGETAKVDTREKVKGIALVKPEYLINAFSRPEPETSTQIDDDAAEGQGKTDDRDNVGRNGKNQKKKRKEKGQNKSRQFGSWFDAIRLCVSRSNSPEFSPKACSFGDTCKCCHDLRKYLREGKRGDLSTFEGKCPVWEAQGTCFAGWRCRFVSSHSKEIEREDGRKELVLIEREDALKQGFDDEDRPGIFNVVSTNDKINLARRRTPTEKSDTYTGWLDVQQKEMEKVYHEKKDASEETREENRANFTDPPFLPSEKRRIYFGAETPVLAPLTTQGNLPFRRMCVDFGAQLTYSEMAMSIPLIQGQKSEWALMKAHQSEISPPRYTPTSTVQNYDNTKDLKFGAQISASKPWQALKAAEVMGQLLPHLRLIDLNCGCPIELVYQSGAGSALLDAPSKLEKMIRGMNAVSGEVPITAKIRMGTKDGKPTAQKTLERLAFGGYESRERLGAPGCAAVTLHGRSRQQRYTKSADWEYIAECAALVKSYNKQKDDLTDTIREADERTQANTQGNRMFFIGNGDCYSHVQYYDDIKLSAVDSVMVARGALIKPWIFEEIEKGQYLDKSASERLGYVEKFVRYGLEVWGSDEVGVGLTRRFLLEWLSFAHRYVPVGILAHLPPSLQDRPPAYRGRSDLETLLASDNYLDWIKISEMYLGPSHKDFKFQPKHKSNSYEIEAEG